MSAIPKRINKLFIRQDYNGKDVPGSGVWRKRKPRFGTWREVNGYLCCNYTTSTTTTLP